MRVVVEEKKILIEKRKSFRPKPEVVMNGQFMKVVSSFIYPRSFFIGKNCQLDDVNLGVDEVLKPFFGEGGKCEMCEV